jgi:phosphoribosylglycinamide formyltransferase 1
MSVLPPDAARESDSRDALLATRRIAVLISGRGTNLQSLIDATAEGRLAASIGIVVSNRADAPGLERASAAGIETLVMSHRDWPTREEYDAALAATLLSRQIALVCLAGFMRIFSAPMLEAYPDRILNIHPSLLPAFPGLHPQHQALEHGVCVSGVTVHLVNAQLDAGPIVVQRTVPVFATDTVAELSARILAEEHTAYPEAVKLVLEGGWTVEGRRFIRGAAVSRQPA